MGRGSVIPAVALSFSLLLGDTPASAATVSLNPINSSHCIQSNATCFGNENVGASVLSGGAVGIRHFMLFDLSGLTGTVTSARLQVEAGQGAYQTFQPAMSYFVSLLSVDTALLQRRVTGLEATSVYNAIALGEVLGSTLISTPVNNLTAQAMPDVLVSLDAGVVQITSGVGGFLALGGYTTTGGSLFHPGLGLPRVGPTGTRLVLTVEQSQGTVPIPSTLALSGLGLLLGFLWRRRSHTS